MKLHRLILPAALLVAVAASAVPLKTDTASSAVSAVFKQMNVPVEARFKSFTVKIDLDPAKPAAGTASVEVDTASLDLGEAEMNKEVAKKDWFNAAQFPKAHFVSSVIQPAGAGKYNVTGKLTIKGKTSDVSFPLTVKADGARQMFDGTLPIRRLAFNVGDGEWKDTSMVADDVLIKFHVVASR